MHMCLKHCYYTEEKKLSLANTPIHSYFTGWVSMISHPNLRAKKYVNTARKINKLSAGVKHCVLKTPVLLGVGSQMVKINQADFPNAACVPRCCGSSQHRLRARSRISEVGPWLFACMPMPFAPAY